MIDEYDDYAGYKLSENDIVIAGCRLICTCNACPEQYEVFSEETRKQIGYLRLRHGFFRADYLNCGGETVYEAYTKGDGVFVDDERMEHLTAAVNALKETHANDN